MARGERLPGDRWTHRDWVLAQAWTLADVRCPECGQPVILAFDPELEKKWSAPGAMRCHPCTALIRTRKKYEGDQSHDQEALRFPVELHQ